MNYPSNSDDVIDPGDVIEAIEELSEGEHIDIAVLAAEALAGSKDADYLLSLVRLATEAADCEDWQYGATLIRDSYFTEYAQELADDLGSFRVRHAYDRRQDRDLSSEWPFTCIDWEHAARELQSDYTAVDFGGVTYWVR